MKESEQKNRRKREVSPDYYSNHVIEGEYDDVVECLESENKNRLRHERTRRRARQHAVESRAASWSGRTGRCGSFQLGTGGQRFPVIDQSFAAVGACVAHIPPQRVDSDPSFFIDP